MKFSICLIILCAGAFGCSLDSGAGLDLFSLTYDFNASQVGWSADFADYKVDDSLSCEFQTEAASLPTNIALNQKSIMLSGNNLGDNLFMFIKKKVSGLRPNSDYTLVFEVEFASNAKVGQASGDNVFLKVGASGNEPKVSESNGYYRLNISKGYGNNGGQEAVVIGSIGVNSTTQDYSLITKSNSSTVANPYYLAHSNSNGELWLIVGTDSTFKGASTVYYTAVSVVLSASK